MPVYEYGCAAGHRFEVKQKMSDAPVTTCPVCNLPVSKLISAPAISFKGSGWYVTDYSDKMKPPGTEGKPGKPTEPKTTSTEGTKDAADKPTPPSPAPAVGPTQSSGATPPPTSDS